MHHITISKVLLLKHGDTTEFFKICDLLGFHLQCKTSKLSSRRSLKLSAISILPTLRTPFFSWGKEFSESLFRGTIKFHYLVSLHIFCILFQFRGSFISFGMREFACVSLCILSNQFFMTLTSDTQCLGFWKSKIMSSLTNFSATHSKINFKLIFPPALLP